MDDRKVRFWCSLCIDRSQRGWWIKNETPAKCDGKEGKSEGVIVTAPPAPCSKQAEWVLIQ